MTRAIVALGFVLLGAQVPPLLPATSIDLNAERVRSLEQELAAARAEIVGLRADVAVAQANTEQARREAQSLLLTNDVDRAMKELERVHPGSRWIWDNDKRRIIPQQPAPSEGAIRR